MRRAPRGHKAEFCPKAAISEMTIEETPTEAFTRVTELTGFDLCGIDSIRGKPPSTPTLCSGYNKRIGGCSCGCSSYGALAGHQPEISHVSTPTTRTDIISHSIPTQLPPRGRITHATAPPPTPFASDDSWIKLLVAKTKSCL